MRIGYPDVYGVPVFRDVRNGSIMQLLLLAAALSAPADSPQFVAVGPTDERPVGKLERVARDMSTTLSTRTGDISISDVLSLRRTDRPLPPFPTGPQLITTAGDRIAGTLFGGDENSLRFVPSGVRLKRNQTWKVPLSSALAVWLVDTPANTLPDPASYEWLAGNKNQDVLRFRNGDTARGTLNGLDPDTANPELPFRPEQGAARSVAARELAAVVFNPSLARTRKPKGSYARVVLSDGSRLSLANVTVASDVLTGDMLFNQKVELPLSAVISIDIMQGKAVYLSDLKPKKVEQAGFLGVAWPWTADRGARGVAMRIDTPNGESTADKGLGTRPRTVLTYDLAGKYQRFEASVGMEPSRGVQSKVTIRVLVDGKEQDIPGLALLAAGNAVPVRVNVKGAKELVLITDFGPTGGVGSDVNWADARLIE